MKAGALLILVGLVASRSSAADEQPICADSPGKASQTCTVPAEHFQVEINLADWTLQKGDRELLFADGNFKFGLDDRSDIGVELIPLVRETSRGDGDHQSASGFGDVGIAYKHRLSPADAPLQVTAFPFVKIPTANRPIGNRMWEAGIIVPLAYNIPGTPLSFNLSPELDRSADEDRHGHHWTMVQVGSLGWQATPKLSLLAEVWGQWDWDPGGTTRQVTFDTSAAYLLRNDLQLDGGANIGLTRNSPDIELYAGFAKRF